MVGQSVRGSWLDSLTWEVFSNLTDSMISHKKMTRTAVFLTALLSILSWLWQPCRDDIAELNSLPSPFLKFPPWDSCAHPAPKHLMPQLPKAKIWWGQEGPQANHTCRQSKKLSCFLSLPKDMKGDKWIVWHTGYSPNMFLPFSFSLTGKSPCFHHFSTDVWSGVCLNYGLCAQLGSNRISYMRIGPCEKKSSRSLSCFQRREIRGSFFCFNSSGNHVVERVKGMMALLRSSTLETLSLHWSISAEDHTTHICSSSSLLQVLELYAPCF